MAGGFCALFLLFGLSWPTFAADEKSLTAIFIVAKDEVRDSDFANAVVLVMNNIGPAPIGVIVNRPTQIPISRLFPDVKRLAQVHDKVYFGGPVEVDTVWFLFRAKKPPAHAIQALDGVCISASLDLLEKLLARDKPMDGLRIYIGHAGWAPGQLEAEIARGSWTLEHAQSDAIFNGKSEHPWPTPKTSKGET